MKKTLYMLIGPKGSGKTHIGTLVNAHTDIAFLRVESIWLGVPPGEDGWKKVEDAIDAEFQTRDQVMVESLGAGEDFERYYASLKAKYTVRMIRVRTDLDTCLARVQKRGAADHIPVSDGKVMEYNRIAAAVSYDWDLEIDNNVPAPDEEILNAILSMNR
jgi:shikimate kinase